MFRDFRRYIWFGTPFTLATAETHKQLWRDGFEGRGLAVNKILSGYKGVVDWPAADFYKASHGETCDGVHAAKPCPTSRICCATAFFFLCFLFLTFPATLLDAVPCPVPLCGGVEKCFGVYYWDSRNPRRSPDMRDAWNKQCDDERLDHPSRSVPFRRVRHLRDFD